ncbi:hypothetical protein C8N24_0200 [Solirubrobacter pauli]|uniref:Uncharacterized protein n=1 Tax=Solirubrobacter pauli TaxID=166793 RepID=A0A660L5W1_9ACTN|nr:hypothetical protein [Solirubrobacter pauli]RKQ90398.1 hypothetical protein C8N24_0200 [Solirubrobacter pauli]
MGLVQVALYAAPFLLLFGLLALGRFPGERTILARRVGPTPPRPRPATRRWAPGRERTRLSQLERTSHRLRGPPLVA